MASSLGLAEAVRPNPFNSLPGLKIPGEDWGFPTKNELADCDDTSIHGGEPASFGAQARLGLELAWMPFVAFVDEGRSHRSHRVRWRPSRPEVDRGRPPGGVPGTSS